jgi:fatty acid desaturase
MTRVETNWIGLVRQTLQQSDADFFAVRPARYWFDFLLCLSLAYTCGTIYLMSPLGSWAQLVSYPLTVFWIYRLGSLIHEVCHLKHREMRVFKVTWNVLVGVLTLAPSPFFTRHHRDHHSQRFYGKAEDPEYIVNVFRRGDWLSLASYALLIGVYPLLVFLRFLLSPLTFLHPAWRTWVLRHASSLTMNPLYVRKLNRFDRAAITGIELLCWARATAMLAAVVLGFTHWTRLPLFYAIALGVLVLNQMRLLADHHFESQGRELGLAEHIHDSCNYTGRDFMTWLLFPFAIRYHALHHLFPSLPYHNLRAAHAYLEEHLPVGSPYRALNQPNWWHVARQTLFAPLTNTGPTLTTRTPLAEDGTLAKNEPERTGAARAISAVELAAGR